MKKHLFLILLAGQFFATQAQQPRKIPPAESPAPQNGDFSMSASFAASAFKIITDQPPPGGQQMEGPNDGIGGVDVGIRKKPGGRPSFTRKARPTGWLNLSNLQRDLTSNDQVYVLYPTQLSTSYQSNDGTGTKETRTGAPLRSMAYVWQVMQSDDGKLVAVPTPIASPTRFFSAGRVCSGDCNNASQEGYCWEKDDPSQPDGCGSFCFKTILSGPSIESNPASGSNPDINFQYSFLATFNGQKVAIALSGTTSGVPEKRAVWCGGKVEGVGCVLASVTNQSPADKQCATSVLQSIYKKHALTLPKGILDGFPKQVPPDNNKGSVEFTNLERGSYALQFSYKDKNYEISAESTGKDIQVSGTPDPVGGPATRRKKQEPVTLIKTWGNVSATVNSGDTWIRATIQVQQ